MTEGRAVPSGRDDGGVLTGTDLFHVSWRELREEPWRALKAAGTSAGEAAVAACIAALVEAGFGCGLEAVLREVHDLRPPLHSPRRQVIEGGRACELADSSGRGLLHLVPLAAELIASRPSLNLVHLPGAEWSSALPGLLATVRVEGDRELGALGFDASGGLLGAARRSPGGDVTVLDCGERPKLADLTGLDESGEGVVLVGDGMRMTDRLTPAALHPRSDLEARWRSALKSGVRVDPSIWEQLHSLSSRYLVSEHQGAPHA